MVDVNVGICSLSNTCESGPEVAGRRVHREAAGLLQRQDPAGGKRTCAHCASAMPREPVALESRIDRFPTASISPRICQDRSSRMFSSSRPRGDTDSCHPETPSPARNKPPRKEEKPSGQRLDGCRDSNEQLAREAMSSSSGIAVSGSESARSWSPGPPSRGRGRVPSDAGLCQQHQRGAILPVPMDEGELLVRFVSRVSICAKVISPTSADRSDWRQCLPRAEAFGLRLGAVAHPQSRQEVDIECPVVAVPRFRFCGVGGLRPNAACAASPRAANATEEAHTNVHGGATSGHSSGGENISRPGLRSSEPSGFRSNARVCEFRTAHHSVNARVVSSRGHESAAGFCMLKWV